MASESLENLFQNRKYDEIIEATEASTDYASLIWRLRSFTSTNQNDKVIRLFDYLDNLSLTQVERGDYFATKCSFYTWSKEFDLATEYYTKTMDIAQILDDKDLEVRALTAQGLNLFHVDRFPEGTELYEKAKEIALTHNLSHRVTTSIII